MILFNCLAPDKAIAIGIGFDFRAVDEDSPFVDQAFLFQQVGKVKKAFLDQFVGVVARSKIIDGMV